MVDREYCARTVLDIAENNTCRLNESSEKGCCYAGKTSIWNTQVELGILCHFTFPEMVEALSDEAHDQTSITVDDSRTKKPLVKRVEYVN